VLPRGLGQAIGMFDDAMLDERRLAFPSGGSLLLFTDGVTDCRNPAGEPFGYERLQARLGYLAGRNAQDLCDLLHEDLFIVAEPGFILPV
jgi:sigma-B regulation protein RsbU (phosphoserine phosphatase)